MKVYTRKGDNGTTGTASGRHLSKSDFLMDAGGSIDELNAHLALVADETEIAGLHNITTILRALQHQLFSAGSDLSMSGSERFCQLLSSDWVPWLESRIDQMDESLKPLREFILPGGSPLLSHTSIARAVCRRAEREITRAAEFHPIPPTLQVFFNRLSDFLFTLERYLHVQLNVPEIVWQKHTGADITL